MSAYQRVLVYLQRNRGPPRLAKFTECIVNSLNLDGDSGKVSCELKDNQLILSSDSITENVSTGLLTHPSFCPILAMTHKQATDLPKDISERGVDVGVVVILETVDKNILLTRRAKHMRTFPGIWVPPGGHVEDGETLLEAGLRELHEETGIKINKSMKTSRILCLWESVYPYILSMGQPKRHHIVVYMLVQVNDDKKTLQNQIDLDQKEVDAAMWLDPVLAKLIAFDKVPAACPEFLQAFVLDNSGAMEQVQLPSIVMTNQAPDKGADVERISTGTRLDKKNSIRNNPVIFQMYEYLIDSVKTLFASPDDKDLAYKLLCVAWGYLINVAIQSYFFPAPYGKFTSATGIGFLNRATKITMPASIGWMLQEIPSFFVSLCAMVHLYQHGMMLKMLLLAPYMVHYFNRSILFPLKIKNGKPAPVLTVVAAFVFCLYNGVMQSHALVSLDEENLSLCGSALGLAIFVAGMVINIQSDQILKNLRKGGETGYKIPYGGLYEYVTSPNYFGEALEWWGFACLVQTSAGVWFGVWSTMFLGGRALQTHSWYKEKFEDYPQERKAFIPNIL